MATPTLPQSRSVSKHTAPASSRDDALVLIFVSSSLGVRTVNTALTEQASRRNVELLERIRPGVSAIEALLHGRAQ